MPRLGPRRRSCLSGKCKGSDMRCKNKPNMLICPCTWLLQDLQTWFLQAKVKAKTGKVAYNPWKDAWIGNHGWKNSCFICGWPMFHPCFAQDFPTWTLLCWGRKRSTGGPDGVGWQAEHCQSWKWKRPHISRVFSKKVARWLKDVLPIGQKSVEDCVRMYWNLTLLKMWGGNDGHLLPKSGQMSEARLWGVVCGEGRLEFCWRFGEKSSKLWKLFLGQEEIIACQKVGEPAYTSVTVWQPGRKFHSDQQDL